MGRYRIVDGSTPGVPREGGRFNVNGPSVLRAPGWMADPPGVYLMYFAHHIGESIRLAAADHPTGPWQVVDPDVLNVSDTPSVGNAPDAPHVASPDVHADHEARKFVMYFHAPVPESVGGHLPCWHTYPTMNQKTMAAASDDGRRFEPIQPVTAVAPNYLRMFRRADAWYGVAMPSQVVRSPDGLRGFEYGPMLFHDDEIRHCCLAYEPRGDRLEMLFTRCYEAPERIYRTVIDTSADWRSWTPGEVVEVLRPAEPWEGAGRPLKAVPRGQAHTPLNGLRDPCLLRDDSADTRDGDAAEGVAGSQGAAVEGGSRWLFYATAGEDALGVTRV